MKNASTHWTIANEGRVVKTTYAVIERNKDFCEFILEEFENLESAISFAKNFAEERKSKLNDNTSEGNDARKTADVYVIRYDYDGDGSVISDYDPVAGFEIAGLQ